MDQWVGFVGTVDSFNDPIGEEFIDGKTKYGPWAIMTPATHEKRGVGLGQGLGQRYRRIDNCWKKVEG